MKARGCMLGPPQGQWDRGKEGRRGYNIYVELEWGKQVVSSVFTGHCSNYTCIIIYCSLSPCSWEGGRLAFFLFPNPLFNLEQGLHTDVGEGKDREGKRAPLQAEGNWK